MAETAQPAAAAQHALKVLIVMAVLHKHRALQELTPTLDKVLAAIAGVIRNILQAGQVLAQLAQQVASQVA